MLVQFIVLYLFTGHALFGAVLPFVIMLSIGTLAHMAFLAFVSPNLAEHRASFYPDTKPWDKVLLSLYFLNTLIVGPMVIGIDITYYRWHQPSVIFQILAIPLYLFALFLILWSMRSNPYFEGTARIQKERHQQVIIDGPYRIVRHPGYLGMIIGTLSSPIIARSTLALLVSMLSVAIVIMRTDLEDKMLEEELEGYKDYRRLTRYRLFPRVW